MYLAYWLLIKLVLLQCYTRVKSQGYDPYSTNFIKASLVQMSFIMSISFKDNTRECIATLITLDAAVTPIGCVKNREFTLRAGSVFTDRGGVVPEVKEIIINPAHVEGIYSNQSIDFDIAIIKLKKPLTESKRISVAKLPDEDNYFPHYSGIVAGWDSEKLKNQSRLYLNLLPNYSWKECRERWYHDKVLFTDRVFCAGKNEHLSRCQQNRGSPYLYRNDLNYWIIYGFVIDDTQCTEIPLLYTSITHNLDFIKKHVDVSKNRYHTYDQLDYNYNYYE